MRCPPHESVMFPPANCPDCIRWTYGKDSDEYRDAIDRIDGTPTALARAALAALLPGGEE